MYNKLLTIEGENIVVLYTKMFEIIAKMVLQYYDKYQFGQTVFVINTLVDEKSDDIDFRQYIPNRNKYIYYQLNDIVSHPEYVSLEHMLQFDEIWDVSLANIPEYDEDLKSKVVFMPLRYVDIPKVEPKDDYKYDICVFGPITRNGTSVLYRNTKWWDDEYCRMKWINGYAYTDCLEELGNCKYVLIIPINDNKIPVDYVMLLNVICSGKQAITFDTEENILHPFVKKAHSYYDITQLVKNPPVDNSNIFKSWTITDNSYEDWRRYWLGNNYIQKLSF